MSKEDKKILNTLDYEIEETELKILSLQCDLNDLLQDRVSLWKKIEEEGKDV